MIKVLIVDDHALVRMGIRRLLDDVSDINVIGEAEDGQSAIEAAKRHHPDVILLDMKMPGMDGWEVTRRLNKSYPSIKIIVVTAMSSEPFPKRILQMGAAGYLTKDSGIEEIITAIRKVFQGERYLSREIAQKIAINSLQPIDSSPFEQLSEREMQVMLMITQGLTVPEIAKKLFLNMKTVNAYRYRMFEKLHIKNNVELTYLALKHGMVEQPSSCDTATAE